MPDIDLAVLVDGVAVSDGNPVPVSSGQHLDLNNSKTLTSADCSPGSPWVGTATVTRAAGYVGAFVSVISASAIGGTYTFQLGENGVSWPVTIGLHSSDFSTIRFRQLLNVGGYIRMQFEPDAPLGSDTVIVACQLSRTVDPTFVVPSQHVFEEEEAAFGATFAFLKAFDDNGLSKNIRVGTYGDLRVSDERLSVTESGSLDTESIRDDISLSFSRDSGAAAIANGLVNLSSGGSAAHDVTHGRVVLSTTSTAGRTAYYESADRAVYESGHMIRGEQTIEISPPLLGTAFVEWGFGEDDGAGAVLNGMGWGMDVLGLYAWRKKAGAYASKVYRADFNRDTLAGVEPSRYVTASGPVAFDPTKNALFLTAFEWLGVAPPIYRVQAPVGEFVTAHVEETSGRISGTTIPEPELPMFVRVSNGDQATDYTVACGSWRGGIYTSATIIAGSSVASTGQLVVTTAADQVAPGAEAGRHALRLKNLVGSARSLYYGFTAGVTVSNGDELAPGEAVEFDIDDRVTVYVITTSTAGAGVRCAWTELA